MWDSNRLTNLNLKSVPDTKQFSIAKTGIQPIPILQYPSITTYKIILPNLSETCAIKFYNDETFGLPYIKSIASTSFNGQQLQKLSLTQQYLISLQTEKSIHGTPASEEFQRLRQTHEKEIITLKLSKRDSSKTANCKGLRTKFDQLQPVIASNTGYVSSNKANNTHLYTPHHEYVPTVAILTHLLIKAITHKNIMDCFHITNPHCAKWKHTAFNQYDKYASHRVFTKP